MIIEEVVLSFEGSKSIFNSTSMINNKVDRQLDAIHSNVDHQNHNRRYTFLNGSHLSDFNRPSILQ